MAVDPNKHNYVLAKQYRDKLKRQDADIIIPIDGAGSVIINRRNAERTFVGPQFAPAAKAGLLERVRVRPARKLKSLKRAAATKEPAVDRTIQDEPVPHQEPKEVAAPPAPEPDPEPVQEPEPADEPPAAPEEVKAEEPKPKPKPKRTRRKKAADK